MNEEADEEYTPIDHQIYFSKPSDTFMIQIKCIKCDELMRRKNENTLNIYYECLKCKNVVSAGLSLVVHNTLKGLSIKHLE